eukprot:gene14164-biopygen2323
MPWNGSTHAMKRISPCHEADQSMPRWRVPRRVHRGVPRLAAGRPHRVRRRLRAEVPRRPPPPPPARAACARGTAAEQRRWGARRRNPQFLVLLRGVQAVRKSGAFPSTRTPHAAAAVAARASLREQTRPIGIPCPS